MNLSSKIIKASLDKKAIRALILDMDGVLWRGDQPIGDLQGTFERIAALEWRVIFATNNASRTIPQYIELLAAFGVKAEPWQVISSSIAAVEYLFDRFPSGGPVYIIGEQGVIEACNAQGFYPADDGALAVIVGIDRKLTYEKLKTATLLIRAGVPFIGTNPDRTFPTPQGLVPGAGSILAAIEAATSVSPIIVGKPEPAMYRIALQRLHLPPQVVLVVGDRPETDIAGAQLIGCKTALVLSGVTNARQAHEWLPAPDLIMKDLETLTSSDW
jgi:4-nitrophenyl phosphatase